MIINGFAGVEDIISQFNAPDDALDNADVLYANYETPPYEGYAHIIFVKDGRLFEVIGSHCSCMGLEGQWSPEETTAKALFFRPNVSDEIKELIRNYFGLNNLAS